MAVISSTPPSAGAVAGELVSSSCASLAAGSFLIVPEE